MAAESSSVAFEHGVRSVGMADLAWEERWRRVQDEVYQAPRHDPPARFDVSLAALLCVALVEGCARLRRRSR